MSMSSDTVQDGLPLYVEGADQVDPNAPGRLAVYDPSTPDEARILTTFQGDLFAPDDPGAGEQLAGIGTLR